MTNCYRRFDLQNPTAPESMFFVGQTQSLQESGLRAAQGQHGGGRRLSSWASRATTPRWRSELHIVDAQRMEEGAVAVVKLPFRLRGGTHVNWFCADELAAQQADSV